MAMRRTITLVGCLLALQGLTSASAGERTRVATAPYNWTTTSPPIHGQLSNYVTFDTESSERFVKVSIRDVSGLAVSGTVEQDIDGDGVTDVITRFCSKTKSRVPIVGGTEVVVGLDVGPCSQQGAPAPISGEVRAAFTR